MSLDDTNALLAAVAMAAQDAAARIQAATISAQAQVDATVQGATIQATADVQVATIEAAWHGEANNVQRDVAQIEADAQVTTATTTAQIDADARRDVASTQAQATVEAAQAESEAHVTASENQANATREAASFDASARVGAAELGANAQIQSAQLGATAETTVATTRAQADVQVATIGTQNQVNVANIEAASRNTVASTTGQFSVQVANIEAGARTQVASTEAGANRYGSDQQLAGINVHETAETNRLNIKLDFANDKFTILQPLLDQIINAGTSFLDNFNQPQGFNPHAGGFVQAPKSPMGFRACSQVNAQAGGDQLGYAGPPTIRMGDLDPPHDGGQGGGGTSTGTVAITAPYIATRGVFTPAMLQQQVNQAYARNDSRTQALIRKSQGDLAGRGFSSISPILEALKVGYITSNLRASIEAASTIRLQAAQANVDAVFRGQNARSEQFLGQEDVLLKAEQNQIQRQVGVLTAVAQLVGGII